MAQILIVHGISNQYSGEMELHKAWYPALCDGLLRVGYAPLPQPDCCFCPFYGDLFRPTNYLGSALANDDEEPEETDENVTALLKAIWTEAASSETAVPGPDSFGETLLRAPRIAERALNALANSKYLSTYAPLQFFGDLKQVVMFLNDWDVHERVLERILTHVGPDTKIVIGHSLGSVVAYEAVCRKPEDVAAFLTLGSPLGLRNVVFDKLTPKPDGFGLGRWPGRVKHWTNIAATGDIVAAKKKLAPFFGNSVEDCLIDSGWDAHSATRYLNSMQAGRAVSRALRP